MESLKLFLLKQTLLDTTILLISVFSLEIAFLYWWHLCFSISVSPNFIFQIFYSIFIYTLNIFYSSFYFIIFHMFCLNTDFKEIYSFKSCFWYLFVKYFYNVPLFSVKSTFCDKFIALPFLPFRLLSCYEFLSFYLEMTRHLN